VTFPENADLFNIGAFRLGDKIVPTHNGMIGRYPGADGMKTGFTCPAGFNLVASASRDNRKIIVVVMGDISARQRTAHAADLFDRAFASSQHGDLASDLASIGGAPPDMRDEVCRRRNKKEQLEAEIEDLSAPIATPSGPASAPQPSNGALIAALPRPTYEPVSVFVGPAPGYHGPVAGPRPANTPIGAIAYAPPEKETAHAPLRPDPAAQSLRRSTPSKRIAANIKAKTKVVTKTKTPKPQLKATPKPAKPQMKSRKSGSKAVAH
jgi:D-alanyl-D-alanine carboxypeptidase